VELTESNYLAVERAYVDAAIAFMKEAEISSLRVAGLENRKASKAAPEDGCLLTLESVRQVLKGLLREEFWCNLEANSSFIHVGWDYYMYVGVPSRCEAAERIASYMGLFPERFNSPYLSDDA
jgi:hypothetical protein